MSEYILISSVVISIINNIIMVMHIPHIGKLYIYIIHCVLVTIIMSCLEHLYLDSSVHEYPLFFAMLLLAFSVDATRQSNLVSVGVVVGSLVASVLTIVLIALTVVLIITLIIIRQRTVFSRYQNFG